MSRNDWIKIDNQYLKRIHLRKALLHRSPEFCLESTPTARPAIEELYEEIMIKQLPYRFPTMFSVKRGILTNRVTGCTYSLNARRLSDQYMLNALAENVEEDFYFMVPDAEGDYRLQAYSSCFPQGLHSATKMGMSVREIHQPVPGYENRLGNGVDKHFRRMEDGVFYGRLNVRIIFLWNPLFEIMLMEANSGPSKPTTTSSSAIWPKTPETQIQQPLMVKAWTSIQPTSAASTTP